MKKIKKIVKLWAIYALITGYCCYVTDQVVDITDPKSGINSGKMKLEFPWKHILDNIEIILNRIKH